MKKRKAFLILSCSLLLIGCKEEKPSQLPVEKSNSEPTQTTPSTQRTDSIQMVRDSLKVQDSLAQIKKELSKKTQSSLYQVEKGNMFDYWPMKASDSLRKVFYSTFSKEERYVIAALNRIDTDHISKRDTLVVPKTVSTQIMDYSPFPRSLPILDSIQKIAIFSYPIQAYALYEKGVLIKWGPTNMGKKASQTPRGLFFTNWKGRKVKSTANDEWILNWNFNISNSGGVGWHQYALPGYPASHSCLRLLDADARMMYDWADQWVLEDKNKIKVKGTPVIVYGSYTFGKKGKWHQLPKDPDATDISDSELNDIITPHLSEILKQQKIRQVYKGEQTDPIETEL